MARRSVLTFTMAALALAMAGDASAQVAKRFGGFSVACDDSRHCAASVQAVNPDKASVFVLQRSPESRARWTVSISTLGVLADRDRPVALSVDNGVDITLRPVSDYAPFVNPSDYYLVSQTALDRLMLQVQRGHMLRFSFIDIAGAPHSDRFPLDGLAPALNEIDMQQGRIPGDRRAGPPVGLPEAAEVDVAAHLASAGVPPRLLELHLASAACEAPDAAGLADARPVIAPLSETATLYAIPCFRNASGLASRLYAIDSGEIGGMSPLLFAGFSDRLGWYGVDVLFDVAYDAASRRLEAAGADDHGCAFRGDWTFTDTAFRLDHLSAATSCGATAAGWKDVYPAR
ncbi:DUF1176 domain-containing protein [Pleomorphomonas carboxyditropha]|uniref:DUF1176 domain-containing protein n=1 Tax=Pleomorphomonas carboxyditropha TaxID=2023338 RepID=A0A2G9WSP6_9HYPH|nr:DUF1176 domain-containing protein [Pleomorphomonas carboxyditropha]PIO97160.1 hypothetical protein CJ014_22080 [Pleomorphomonas carboxyditropha]